MGSPAAQATEPQSAAAPQIDQQAVAIVAPAESADAGALSEAIPAAPGESLTETASIYRSTDIQYSNIPVCMLNTDHPLDRIVAVVSSNEGKPTSIDWNDNGKGVSVGIFQANQKVGELPDVLHKLAADEQGQQAIASTLGTDVAEAVQNNPEVVRNYSFSPKNSLGKGLKKLVHNPVFLKLQLALLRHKVARAADVAAEYGIHSTAGVAVCADLINQWGPGGAQRWLQAAYTMQSEGGKVKAIVNAVRNRSPYGDRYTDDLEKIAGNGLSYDQPFPRDTFVAEQLD
jgi:hypothetical protein